jgi:hypothetical protein
MVDASSKEASSKPIAKAAIEEKKIAAKVEEKIEKSPPTEKNVVQTKPTTNVSTSNAPAIPPSKSAMRLATVTTPPRKKPPPTIKKTVTSTTSAQQKTTVVKAAVASEKPKAVAEKLSVETPKPASSASANKRSSNSTGPSVDVASNVTPKTKRVRTKVQPYQSPTPELALVTKLSTQIAHPSSGSNSSKNGEEKLTIFYK